MGRGGNGGLSERADWSDNPACETDYPTISSGISALVYTF